MSLRSTINTIVSDTLDIDEESVTGELSPDNAEYWDSMAHLMLVTAIEGEYGIKFSMQEVQSITKVNDIYAIVENHMEEQ